MVVAITLVCFDSLAGQRPGTPPAAPDPLQVNRDIEDRNRTSDRFESIRRDPEIKATSDELRLKMKRELEPLYRKPTKAELAQIAPDQEDAERFKTFLKLPKTGILKLIPDAACPENIPIVNASPECLKYTMPGNGSSYSFRMLSYRIARLSDITLLSGRFATKGFMAQGILVDIGDVPIESVSAGTAGMSFLTAFSPATDVQTAAKIDAEFLKGVQNGGFLYKRTVALKENTTIVLRSSAYKGPSPRSYSGVTYDEFTFDRRSDVTVAFRVIRKHVDGSVTIIWREIDERKAPSMEKQEGT